MSLRRGGFLVFGLCLLSFACDDKRAKPVATSTANNAPATRPLATGRPTTREIIASGRQSVRLATTPLEMDVPGLWKLESVGSVQLLRGPAPNDDLVIRISEQRNPFPDAAMPKLPGDTGAPDPVTWSKDAVDFQIKQARDQNAKDPAKYPLGAVRPLGDAQLLEQQMVRSGTSTTSVEATPAPARPASLEYTLTIYAPTADKRFHSYQLSFIGLTTVEYTADREFIQDMLATLRYVPTLEGKGDDALLK